MTTTITREAFVEILKTRCVEFTREEINDLMNEELDKDPNEMDLTFVDMCLDALEGKFDYLKEAGVGNAVCKSCFHYDLCRYNAYQEAKRNGKAEKELITIDNRIACKFYKDSSRIMVPPCKVGDTVYCIRTWPSGRKTIHPFEAPDWDWIMEHLNDFGKTIYTSRKEAEESACRKRG